MYEIKKNVPIPAPKVGAPFSPLRMTLRAMEVGDMFEIECAGDVERASMHQKAKNIAYRDDLKIAVRKSDAGLSVWLLEKKS
jgi:hypothetical protein